MNPAIRFNWLTYLVTGAIALVASSVLSGCVFGNNEVDQPAAWDGVTGYYDTQFASITFCATFAGQSQATCAAGTADQIPSAITSVLAPDPVELALQSSGETEFVNPADGSSAMVFTVNSSTLAISLPSDDSPIIEQAWTDPNCVETDSDAVNSGQLTRYTGAAHTEDGVTITGRVGLSYQTTSSFAGTCTASLTGMTACYENVADCDGSSQEENGEIQQSLEALYSTLINPAVDLGIVSLTTGSGAPADSIANLVSISMSVSYQ